MWCVSRGLTLRYISVESQYNRSTVNFRKSFGGCRIFERDEMNTRCQSVCLFYRWTVFCLRVLKCSVFVRGITSEIAIFWRPYALSRLTFTFQFLFLPRYDWMWRKKNVKLLRNHMLEITVSLNGRIKMFQSLINLLFKETRLNTFSQPLEV